MFFLLVSSFLKGFTILFYITHVHKRKFSDNPGFICTQKDDVSSSSANEEEQGQNIQVHIKKNPHQGKKLKERSSPPTSENEDKMAVDGNSDPEDMSKKEEAASTGNDNPKVICRTCTTCSIMCLLVKLSDCCMFMYILHVIVYSDPDGFSLNIQVLV